MLLHSLVLLAATGSAPAFAYLAPQNDVWQVWRGGGAGPPRMLTRDAVDKIHLSPGRAAGDLLVVTRDGRGLILESSGAVRETIDLGEGVSEASLSPDGRLLAMAREELSGGARERHIWILDRGDGSRRRLVPRGGLQRAPGFSADGASVVFTAGAEGGSQDLWRLRLDGSSEEQLTTGSGPLLDPAVGPDGSIFVAARRTNTWDIWRLDAKSLDLSPVVSMQGQEGQPAPSRDGRRLLFVSRQQSGSAVWIARVDGTDARRLTDPQGEVRFPTWLEGGAAKDTVAPASMTTPASAKPERIAFLKVTDGTWQPWEVAPDGSGLRPLARLASDVSRLTASADGRLLLANSLDGTLQLLEMDAPAPRTIVVEPAGSTDAALSPDGRKIVYSVNTLESIDANDLWLVAVSGGNARKLTDQPFLQHFPVWADNDRIYYLSGRGGQSHDIWSVEAGTGKTQSVVAESLYNFEPAVSSRGDVAFSSNRGGDYDIWLLRKGAAQPERITTEAGYDGQPAFSPDGSHLVHVARRGGAARLVVTTLEGGAARILPMDGDARLPVWYGPSAPAAQAKLAEARP